MFVKILSRKNPSYRQLVEYILKDRKPTKSAKDIIKHNIKGTTLEAIVKEFEKNETFRTFKRSDQIALYHEIISLSSNEEHYIPDEVMMDLCRKYLDLRGVKGMYLAALHRDTEHCHAHVMSSALEYATGKAHRISRSALQDIKILLQDYHLQKYPEITESFCDHSKGRNYAKNKEYHRRHKEERTKLKESVQQQVQYLFKQSKSFDEFLVLLRENGLHHYERGGIATGLMVEETKIRFSRLGIPKEEIEQLKQSDLKQGEKEPIQEPIKNNNMKVTDFNRPLDTEDVNYKIPIDEFGNLLDFEHEIHSMVNASELLINNELSNTENNESIDQIFSSEVENLKDLDIDLEL